MASLPVSRPASRWPASIGEKSLTESGVRQLHEFGIVYHPRGPYLLGVMTKGHEFARLAAVIREISGAVYTEVSSQRQE